jgi:hypothetical protein
MGRMLAAWFNLPGNISRFLKLDHLDNVIKSIEAVHFREGHSQGASVYNTTQDMFRFFHSSFNYDFFMEMISFLGTGSDTLKGCDVSCITRGTAVLTLLALSLISRVIPIVSSM